MIVFFWFFLALVIYTYMGFPLFLKLLLTFKCSKEVLKGEIVPFISTIIPAYNEGASITEKINNVLSLDYPKDKLEIIIASDASTDTTDEIVHSFADKGVILSRLKKRGGKVAAYKQAIAAAKGEIIIFSDATSILEEKSFLHIVKNFNDPKVGCVGGMLRYEEPKIVSVGKGEHSYWEYNKDINYLESQIDSMASVSGTFFAVRKELYPTNMAGNLAEDLIVPLNVKRKGYRTILEPDAVCFESTVQGQDQEIRKRSRITVQNLHGLFANADMLNIFKYGLFSVFLISHKLFRSLSPLFLISLLVANYFLAKKLSIYTAFFMLQIIFYVIGFISGFLHEKRPKLYNYVYFFCLSNFSILLGILMFLSGYKVVTWETERET